MVMKILYFAAQRIFSAMVHNPKFWFQVSGFSPAAGQKNGRSNRKRNFEKANIE